MDAFNNDDILKEVDSILGAQSASKPTKPVEPPGDSQSLSLDYFRRRAEKDYGLRVSSSNRKPGSLTKAGKPSFHGMRGAALDLVGDPKQMRRFAEDMEREYGSQLDELIYTPLGRSIKRGKPSSPIAADDHKTHVHLAFTGNLKKAPQRENASTNSGDILPEVDSILKSGNSDKTLSEVDAILGSAPTAPTVPAAQSLKAPALSPVARQIPNQAQELADLGAVQNKTAQTGQTDFSQPFQPANPNAQKEQLINNLAHARTLDERKAIRAQIGELDKKIKTDQPAPPLADALQAPQYELIQQTPKTNNPVGLTTPKAQTVQVKKETQKTKPLASQMKAEAGGELKLSDGTPLKKSGDQRGVSEGEEVYEKPDGERLAINRQTGNLRTPDESYTVDFSKKPKEGGYLQYAKRVLADRLAAKYKVPTHVADAVLREESADMTDSEIETYAKDNPRHAFIISGNIIKKLRERPKEIEREIGDLLSRALPSYSEADKIRLKNRGLSEEEIRFLESGGEQGSEALRYKYLGNIKENVDVRTAYNARVNDLHAEYLKQYPKDVARKLAEVTAAREVGWLDEASEKAAFQKTLDAHRIERERLASEKSLPAPNAYANPFLSESWNTDASGLARNYTDEEISERIGELVKEYGSIERYHDEQERIKKEYNPNFRAMARPLEFAKGFASAVPQAVSSVLKTVDIVREILPVNPVDVGRYVLTGERFKATEGFSTQIAKGIDALNERAFGANPDLRSYNQAGNVIGQMGIQLGLGAATGGITAPIALGSAMGASEQYEAAEKGGATDIQRRTAALLGGVLAVSDAIPLARFLRPLTKTQKAGFLNSYLNSVFGSAAKEVGERQAAEITKTAFQSMIESGIRRTRQFAAGGALESGQEVLIEKKGNDLYASLTYDPKRKVWTISDEDKAEAFFAFLGGAAGATGSIAIEKHIENQLETPSFAGALPNIPQVQPDAKNMVRLDTLAEIKPEASAIAQNPFSSVAAKPAIGSIVQTEVKGKIRQGRILRESDKGGHWVVDFEDGSRSFVPKNKASVIDTGNISENLPISETNEQISPESTQIPQSRSSMSAENILPTDKAKTSETDLASISPEAKFSSEANSESVAYKPQPEAPQGEIAQAFSRFGKGDNIVTEDLRNKLWEKVEKGDTTELGAPSNLLLAAQKTRERGGLKTQEEFNNFTEEFFRAADIKEKDQKIAAINEVIKKYSLQIQPVTDKPVNRLTVEPPRANRGFSNENFENPQNESEIRDFQNEDLKISKTDGRLSPEENAKENLPDKMSEKVDNLSISENSLLAGDEVLLKTPVGANKIWRVERVTKNGKIKLEERAILVSPEFLQKIDKNLSSKEKQELARINYAAHKRTGKAPAANPEKHSLAQFVALNGGILPGTVLDTAALRNLKFGIRPLVSEKGKSAEDMMRSAIESGYLEGVAFGYKQDENVSSLEFSAQDFLEAVEYDFRKNGAHYSAAYYQKNQTSIEEAAAEYYREKEARKKTETDLTDLSDDEFTALKTIKNFFDDAEVKQIIDRVGKTGELSAKDRDELFQIGYYEKGLDKEDVENTLRELESSIGNRQTPRREIAPETSDAIGETDRDSDQRSQAPPQSFYREYQPERDEIDESEPEEISEEDLSFDFADEEAPTEASHIDILRREIASLTSAIKSSDRNERNKIARIQNILDEKQKELESLTGRKEEAPASEVSQPAAQEKPADNFTKDLFGNEIFPTHQESLFGKSENAEISEGFTNANIQANRRIFGDKTADYIGEMLHSKEKSVERAASDIVTKATLIESKGEAGKQIAEDVADALDVFRTAREQKSTVSEVLQQPRLDGVEFSSRAKDFALAMEAGNFSSVFGKALSEAKTELGNIALKSVADNNEDDAINLENLYNEGGEVNYEEVSDTAEKVISGTYQIQRLDREGESGRIKGGFRSVEASLIVGANESSVRSRSRDDSGAIRRLAEIEQQLLEDYARRAGVWFDFNEFVGTNKFLSRGTESRIYRDENEPGFVLKLSAIPAVLGDETASPTLRFLDDKIALHNALPLSVPYELVGFTRDENNAFLAVLRQPFVQGEEVTRLDSALAKKLQTEAGLLLDSTGQRFTNSRITVHDIITHNVIKDENGQYHIFDPIISLTDETEYQPFSIRPSGSVLKSAVAPLENTEPAFYLTAIRAVEKKISGSQASVEQVRNILNSSDVKGSEIEFFREFAGIDEWLDSQPNGKVKKRDLIDFLNENNVQIQETVFGENAPEDLPNEDLETLERRGYEAYWLEDLDGFNILGGFRRDGKNYSAGALFEGDFLSKNKELSEEDFNLMVNAIEAEVNFNEGAQAGVKYEKYSLSGGENYQERVFRFVHPNVAPYEDSHWSKPVDFWVRAKDFTDADGARVLLLEEVQSGRHQEGRKKGFKSGNQLKRQEEIARVEKELENAPNESERIRRNAELFVLKREPVTGIADAPFKKSWHELAFKKMLRYAVENGYDKIAWTPGDVQAERYKLSKRVEKIESATSSDVRYVTVTLKNAEAPGFFTVAVNNEGVAETSSQKEFEGKRLDEILSKEIADRIMQENRVTLEGSDLKIGGEGMRGFYDKMLPDFVRKYVKKWGGQVERRKSLTLPKPQSIGELSENFFGTRESSGSLLNVMNAGVVTALDHDQVVEAVVGALPVNVVNTLSAHGINPELFVRQPKMFADGLPVNQLRSVGFGMNSALTKIATILRTGLESAFKTGLDIELLPALKTSQLTLNEAVGILFPMEFYQADSISGDGIELSGATLGAEAVDSRSGIRSGGSENTSALLTDFIDFHNKIIAHHAGNAPLSADRWQVTITPEMRQSVLSGQALFKKADEESRTLLTSTLPRAHTEDVLSLTTGGRITENGDFEGSEGDFELMRRLLAENYFRLLGRETEETPFEAITLDAGTLQKIVAIGREVLPEYEKAGYSEQQLSGFKKLLDNLDALQKESVDYGVAFIFDEALPEEKFHQEDFRAGRTDREAITGLKQSPFWQSSGTRFSREYPNINPADKASEIAAKLATNQAAKYGWDKIDNFETERENFLKTWAQGIVRRNRKEIESKGIEAFKDKFKRISQYADFTQSNQRGSRETQSEETGSDSAGGPNRRDGKRDGRPRDNTGATGATAPGSQSPDNRASALEKGITEEAEAFKTTPAEIRAKNRKYAATLRENGRDAEDVPYIPESEQEWIDEAKKILADSRDYADAHGVSDYARALDVFHSSEIKPSTKTALGIALIDHLGAAGDYAAMLKVAEITTVHVGTAAQALRASQLVSKYDFTKGIQLAQKALEARGKNLSENEIEKIRELTEKYATSERERAFLDAALKDAQEAVELLKTENKEINEALGEAKEELQDMAGNISNLKRQLARWKNKALGLSGAAQRVSRTQKELANRKQAILDKLKTAFPESAGILKSALVSNPELEKIRKFVEDAINNPVQNKVTISLGAVSQQNAERILKETGFDVSGYERVIDNYSVKHSFKKHGSEATEAPRGQIAITADDFARIPEIVENADRIENAGKTPQGRDTILYVKRFNGETFYFEEIRTGKNELVPSTLYKRKSPVSPTSHVQNVFVAHSPQRVSAETDDNPDNNTDSGKENGSILKSAVTSDTFDDSTREALVEYAALQIFESVPYAEVIENLNQITDGILTESEIKAIHADAVDMTRGEAPQKSDEVIEKLKIKGEHRKEAHQFRKSQNGNLNRLEREILKLAGDDEQLAAAGIMWNKAKSKDDWFKKIALVYPELSQKEKDTLFIKGKTLRDEAKNALLKERLENKREIELTESEFEAIQQQTALARSAVRRHRLTLDRYYEQLTKSAVAKTIDIGLDIFSFPKSLMSTGEISYILRQGFLPLALFTKDGLNGLKGVAKGFASEETRLLYEEQLRSDPMFRESEMYGVEYGQIGDHPVADEHFTSRVFESAAKYTPKNAIGKTAYYAPKKIARAQQKFEFAYTLPGDAQRFYVYKTLANLVNQQANLTPEQRKEAKRFAAGIANKFTGRGNLKGIFAPNGYFVKFLNALGFSPKFVAGRFQSGFWLSPISLPFVPKGLRRQIAMKQLRWYGTMAVLAAMVLLALDSPDDDDERSAWDIIDPASKNFLKGRIRGTDQRFDLTANMSEPMRLFFANWVASGIYAARGDWNKLRDIWEQERERYLVNDMGEPLRFLRGKLSPSASYIADALYGKDYLGRDFDWWMGAKSRMMPLTYQQAYDALTYNPYESLMREPVRDQSEAQWERLKRGEVDWRAFLTVGLVAALGGGIQNFAEIEQSRAEQKAWDMYEPLNYGKKKTEEEKRASAGLRKLYRLRSSMEKRGEDLTAVDVAIQKYAAKYNVKNLSAIKEQAAGSRFEFVTKNFSEDQIQLLIDEYATDKERAELKGLLKKKVEDQKKKELVPNLIARGQKGENITKEVQELRNQKKLSTEQVNQINISVNLGLTPNEFAVKFADNPKQAIEAFESASAEEKELLIPLLHIKKINATSDNSKAEYEKVLQPYKSRLEELIRKRSKIIEKRAEESKKNKQIRNLFQSNNGEAKQPWEGDPENEPGLMTDSEVEARARQNQARLKRWLYFERLF